MPALEAGGTMSNQIRAFFHAAPIFLSAIIGGILGGVLFLRFMPGPAYVGGAAGCTIGALAGFYILTRRTREEAGTRHLLLTALYLWLWTAVAIYCVFPMFETSHYFLLNDAVDMLIWIAVSLFLILLALFTGHGLASRRKSTADANLDEGPAGASPETRGVGPAMAVPVMLTILFCVFIYYNGMQGQERFAINYAKRLLKNLATAQGQYFSENGKYAKNFQLLAKKYKLLKPGNIQVEITRADNNNWEGRVVIVSTGKTFAYSSKDARIR